MGSLDRCNSSEIRARLQRAGAWSKKSLGQHFLVDRAVLDCILETAQVSKADSVVEIGPGLGVLSEQLLERAGSVLAFEMDPQMVTILQEDFPSLEVVPGDVLVQAVNCLREWRGYKLVANIPYQITTPLLHLFLEGEKGVPRPMSLTLLVQKEVAQRLTAPVGKSDRGYLSVLTEFFAEPSLVRTVQASSFWPEPKVDSAILQLNVREERVVPVGEERAFLRFVSASFAQKRKQLKNVIAGIKARPTAEIGALLVTVGLGEKVRAQDVSLLQWRDLYHQLAG